MSWLILLVHAGWLVNDCSIVATAAIAIEMKVSLRAFLFLHDFGMVMGRMSTVLWCDTVIANDFGTGTKYSV